MRTRSPTAVEESRSASAGCATFFGGDALIDRLGGAERYNERSAGVGLAFAILLGIVLDGIPESIVLGLTVLEGGEVGIAFLAAVWLSNLPEAVAASTGLAAWLGASPDSRRLVVVMLVSGLAALAGYGLFDGASPSTLAFVNAFAAGAILTMLADTMMPEAFSMEASSSASSRRSGCDRVLRSARWSEAEPRAG